MRASGCRALVVLTGAAALWHCGGRTEPKAATETAHATATAAPSATAAATASDPPPAVSTSIVPAPAIVTAPPSTPAPAELAPGPSSMDELLARARVLEPTVAAIAKEADAVDPEFRRYVVRCHDKYARRRWEPPASPAGGREWFALAAPGGSDLPWQDTWTIRFLPYNEIEIAQCRDSWTALAYGAARVLDRLDTVKTEARRHGVLPGHLRDLLERYRLLR